MSKSFIIYNYFLLNKQTNKQTNKRGPNNMQKIKQTKNIW